MLSFFNFLFERVLCACASNLIWENESQTALWPYRGTVSFNLFRSLGQRMWKSLFRFHFKNPAKFAQNHFFVFDLILLLCAVCTDDFSLSQCQNYSLKHTVNLLKKFTYSNSVNAIVVFLSVCFSFRLSSSHRAKHVKNSNLDCQLKT